MRRILSILGVVVAIVIIVLLGYYFSRNRAAPEVETPTAPTYPTKLPSAPAFNAKPGGGAAGGADSGDGDLGALNPSRFGTIAPNPVLAYFVDSQNTTVLIQPDGKIYRVLGGTAVTVSERAVDRLATASFSKDGQKILATIADENGDASSTKVFDVPTKTWSDLPSDIKSPTWSPVDERIVFFSSNNKDFSVLATLDLKNPKAKAVPVFQIYAQDLTLAWTSSTEVIVSEKSSSFAEGSVWRLDLGAKALLPIVTDLPGALVAWDSAAKRGVLFASARGNRGGDLSIVNANGSLTSRLQLTTLPPKCTFGLDLLMPSSTPTSTPSSSAKSSTKKVVAKPVAPKPIEKHTLICGFPKNLQGFNIDPQPDSYLQRRFYSDDLLYRIDMDSGIITNLFPENDGGVYVVDASQLQIVNKRLFFVNRYDNKLYALDLAAYPVTP